MHKSLIIKKIVVLKWVFNDIFQVFLRYYISYLLVILRNTTFRRGWNYFSLQVLYAASLLLKRPFIAPYPFAVSAETVRGCNLACSDCPAGYTRGKEIAQMPFNVFIKGIDELSFRAFYLQLWFQGEPLLHKGLEEIIGHAVKKKMFTVIATNGTLLNENICAMIIRCGLGKIIVSADTGNGFFHVGGSLDNSLTNIHRLAEMKKQTKSRFPLIEAQMVVTRDNENQTTDFKNKMMAAGADRVVFKSAWFKDLKNPDLPVPARHARYVKNTDGTWRTRKPVRNRCRRIFSTIVIGFNGDVVPCCFDKTCRWVLGNVKEENAGKIWRGEVFQRYRKEILNDRKQRDICQNCTE